MARKITRDARMWHDDWTPNNLALPLAIRTQTEVGNLLGCSKQCVQQIERMMFWKLRRNRIVRETADEYFDASGRWSQSPAEHKREHDMENQQLREKLKRSIDAMRVEMDRAERVLRLSQLPQETLTRRVMDCFVRGADNANKQMNATVAELEGEEARV